MNNVLLIIAIIVFIVYFLGFVFSILTIYLERKYKKQINEYKVSKYIDIYVLLPAMKEQKIVKSTIDWFHKIKYKGNIKFIVITTEKEELEYKTNNIKDKTTNIVVKEYLNKLNDKRFIHYHYPKTNGNKSSQMNYAIDMIKNEYKINNNDTYISVFDFDSQPELNTFDVLNQVAE